MRPFPVALQSHVESKILRLVSLASPWEHTGLDTDCGELVCYLTLNDVSDLSDTYVSKGCVLWGYSLQKTLI